MAPLMSRLRRIRFVLAGVMGLGLLACGYWFLTRPTATSYAPAEDPRLTFPTSLQNVRPSVEYVGDKACSECHTAIAETYRQHPMGQSVATVASVLPAERFDQDAHNPFKASGLEFKVEKYNGKMIHKTFQRDSQGQVIAESQAEVRYAIGAGKRGRSYLIDRNGYLYQSPISWYAGRKCWDLSPHLGTTIDQLYRPVLVGCLFCHTNRADWIEQSGNHYRAFAPQDLAIGCERCHGPGELHVKLRQNGNDIPGPDDTIVNPRHLSPALREAVCEQCHLEGLVRIDHAGRQPFDFRPGLPLYLFMSVFVRSSEEGNHFRFASQVEQMYSSKCYHGSQGSLGCTSCHDPHRVPAENQKVLFYRDRCLTCHQVESCSLTPARRRELSRFDSCIECHMQKFENSDIAHMASTDHRILRRADHSGQPGGSSDLRQPEDPSAYFYKDFVRADDFILLRDQGVAMMDQAGLKQPSRHRLWLARLASPLLDTAVQNRPDDAVALHAEGYAHWLQRRPKRALAAFEKALESAPEREETLAFAAGVAAQLDQVDKALGYWYRARAVNPYSVRAHYELAKLLGEQQGWQAAYEDAHAAVELDPFQLALRRLLIRACLGRGEQGKAFTEFDKLLKLDPGGEKETRKWFKEQLGSAGISDKK
jgi:hypothetical protein